MQSHIVALVNADRCSSLAILNHDNVQWTISGFKFTVVWLAKTRRLGTPRKVFYLMFRDNSKLYPVTVLHLYMDKNAEQVAELSSLKPVFWTSRKPLRQTIPGRISHWIKDAQCIDKVITEEFSAHALRNASTLGAAVKNIRHIEGCQLVIANNY